MSSLGPSNTICGLAQVVIDKDAGGTPSGPEAPPLTKSQRTEVNSYVHSKIHLVDLAGAWHLHAVT